MTDVFNIKSFDFPEGFLWGSSTAAHQIEGDNIYSSNWYNEQKKVAAGWNGEASGKACNHYNMVEEDAQLLADLGHRAFRMGVEWARIEPHEGEFCKEAAEHYVRELALLKEKGLKTFVTLVHFSVPKWFADKGDFQSLENMKYFERYLNYILPQIAPYVDFWNVINEFNLGLSEKQLTHKFGARTRSVLRKAAKRRIRPRGSAL